MTRSASTTLPASDFDEFLYALIGEDRNGNSLSVLSVLARSDVDPWEEAATFAKMPTETATHRLASLIGTLPDGPLRQLDPSDIAARLIALLPRRTASKPPASPPPPTQAPTAWQAASRNRIWIILIAIFVVLMVCAQFIMPA